MTDKFPRCVGQRYGLLEKITSQLFDGENSADKGSACRELKDHLSSKA